jgi:uncharacterized protein
LNGQAVGFDRTLTNDADAEIFPIEIDNPISTHKHLQTSQLLMFVADGHLGKLARNLRLLGFDVAYDQRPMPDSYSI